MRHFVHLAYNGSRYRGWQRQPNAPSVQETLEGAFSKMLGEKTTVIGCGRTDAEVHADRYFAHLDVPAPLSYDPVQRINRILPDDIAVFDMTKMPARAHAQFDAKKRTYVYRLHSVKNPFLRETSTWFALKKLNSIEMKQAVKLMKDYRDFRAFCKTPDIYPNTICDIFSAEFKINDSKTHAVFRITANRFLRGMIRLCVGNILLVGQGRMTVAEFENHLKTRVAPKFYTAAPPQGLYLTDVEYDYAELENCSHKSVFPPLLF